MYVSEQRFLFNNCRESGNSPLLLPGSSYLVKRGLVHHQEAIRHMTVKLRDPNPALSLAEQRAWQLGLLPVVRNSGELSVPAVSDSQQSLRWSYVSVELLKRELGHQAAQFPCCALSEEPRSHPAFWNAFWSPVGLPQILSFSTLVHLWPHPIVSRYPAYG